MPIFSRRSIHCMLRQIEWHLNEQQIERYIGLFNDGDQYSIPFQWELAFIYALSFVGRVVHEPTENGVTLLDAHVNPYDAAIPRFACEITTVSSDNLHNQNPLREFQDALENLITKRGLDPANFSVAIGHERIESYHDLPITEYYYLGTPGSPRQRLLLPSKGTMYRDVRNEINRLLDRIRKTDPGSDQASIARDGIFFRLRYLKGRRLGLAGGNAVYDLAFSLKKNPVYRALDNKRKKLEKISMTHGHRGIIICDGGIMTSKHHSPTGYYFTIDQIITSFMRKRSNDVDFVLTASMVSSLREKKHLEVKLYLNPKAGRPLSQQAGNAILHACSYIPRSTVSSSQIRERLKRRPKRRGDHDVLSWRLMGDAGSVKIKLSARVLLRYLAGEIDAEQFKRNVPSRDTINFFKHALDSGRLINDMRIEKQRHCDDDWVVIELKAGDIATSDFARESWISRKIKHSSVIRKLVLARSGRAMRGRTES
jgi:hypothetical protein